MSGRMPRLADSKIELVLAAALASLALLSSTARHPRRPGGPGPAAPPQGAAWAPDEATGERDAETPIDIPARSWWTIVKRVIRQISTHRLSSEAAGITFYTILAIFPALAAIVSLYGLIADPATVSDHLNMLSAVIPGGGMEVIRDQVRRLSTTGNGTLGLGAIGGLLIALWSANGGTKATFDSLNIVYDEREKRSYLKLTLITLATTLGILCFVVITMAGVVAAPIALDLLGLSPATETLIKLARWPLLLVTVSVMLAFLYRYGPCRERSCWKWVSWGGAFAAIAWLLASLAFSWYVASFGSYNETYGSLGAAIGFMTWIWISTIVVLTGAALDAEMEHLSRPDRAEAARRPLEAAVADTMAA